MSFSCPRKIWTNDVGPFSTHFLTHLMSEKAKAGHACQNLPRFHPPSEFHAIREKWMKWSTFRPWNDDKTKKSLPQMIMATREHKYSPNHLSSTRHRIMRETFRGKDLKKGKSRDENCSSVPNPSQWSVCADYESTCLAQPRPSAS